MNQRQLLETEQKALEINLDPQIYGTFAEIGAGQEVARHFFQVGAAAGTIAKTMSAYDKVYSDQIYGTEPTNRYVCEARIYKMLTHEYDLMMDRLRHDRPKDNFFVFADTVAALNYSRTIKGNGWLGLRFQLTPEGKHNDLVLHVRMLDNDNQLQQQAIGILGVNMIYGAYHYKNDPETLLQSLLDNLKGRIAIDMLVLDGPDFEHVDNRLLSLWLVKHGLTEFTMFDPSGRSTHPSEFLYRKAVMVVRGSFRPPTLVNQDMVETGYAAFREDPNVEPKKSYLITELTLDNLKQSASLDERDYLDRVRLLNALGQTVLVSNYGKHDDLLAYLSEYKVPKLGIVLGVQQLLDLITEKYNNNLDGRLLAAFGEIFTRNVKIYVYPAQQQGSEDLMRAENVPIPEGVKFLYRHLLDNGQIVDIEGFRSEILHIFSTDVLARIENGGKDWEEMVPERVAELIKKDCLFGYPSETLAFSY